MASGGERTLWYILGGLCVVLVVVMAVRHMPGSAAATPEELVKQALEAPTPEEQEDAAIELGRHGMETFELTRRVFRESTVPEVRAAAARALGQWLDVDSLPDLIDAMEDPSETVRDRAGTAVQQITGMDVGFDAGGPLAERQKIVAKFRGFWADAEKDPNKGFINHVKEQAKAKADAAKAAAASEE